MWRRGDLAAGIRKSLRGIKDGYNTDGARLGGTKQCAMQRPSLRHIQKHKIAYWPGKECPGAAKLELSMGMISQVLSESTHKVTYSTVHILITPSSSPATRYFLSFSSGPRTIFIHVTAASSRSTLGLSSVVGSILS